jgi:hypothetical protein
MTEISNSKPVLVIEYWNLRFVCNLVLRILGFNYCINPADCRKRGKTIEVPSGGSPQPGFFEPVFFIGCINLLNPHRLFWQKPCWLEAVGSRGLHQVEAERRGAFFFLLAYGMVLRE